MDITKRVAHNLSAWMEGHKTLGTLKKIAAASGVGFGTVRRALGREPGNITVQNLEAIAEAFGKTAADLLKEPTSSAQPPANETPALYLLDEAHRVPARLAKLTEADLDKLLAVLNLIETLTPGAAVTALTATPAKPAPPGWSNLPAGDPEPQPTADTDHQDNT